MNIDLTSQEDQDDQEAERGAPSPISVVPHSYPFIQVGLGAPLSASWFLVNIRYILWEENDPVQGVWMDGDGGYFFYVTKTTKMTKKPRGWAPSHHPSHDQEAERVGAEPSPQP